MQDVCVVVLRVKLTANQKAFDQFEIQLATTDHPSKQIQVIKVRLPYCVKRSKLLEITRQLVEQSIAQLPVTS